MTQERDIEKVNSVEDFVKKLRRVADALETGKKVEFHFAGEKISVPDNAEFSIEHEREDGEEELEFQIKWKPA